MIGLTKAWGIALVGAASLGAMSCAPARSPDADGGPTIRLTLRRFAFAPSVIRLRKGAPSTIELVSLDVAHGFVVPDLGVRADVIPGRIARIRVVPSRAGTLAFRCDVFCGSGHDDMVGEISVL